jgi:hypothetical protein
VTKPAPLVWLAFGVAFLAVVETGISLWAPHAVAAPDEWHAAAAEVRAGFRPGDLIVFAPYWADQRGRAELGDLMPVDMVGRSDDARYARIWELSIRGSHAPEVSRSSPKSRSSHGSVDVALYEKPAAEVLWNSTARFTDARVTGRAEPRTMEIDYAPRFGILAPLETGRPTTLEWTDVPLGSTLVGWAGLHDYYARKNADGPIDVSLFIDGAQVLSQRVTNGDAWKRFEAKTQPGRHDVKVVISAPNVAWRNAGFHLEARK